jgi:hypothetical protein
MRKVYDSETDLLECVHVIMSPTKPESSENELLQEEPIAQRRCRRSRVSKQRAKALISEYCTRSKTGDNVKLKPKKRNY